MLPLQPKIFVVVYVRNVIGCVQPNHLVIGDREGLLLSFAVYQIWFELLVFLFFAGLKSGAS